MSVTVKVAVWCVASDREGAGDDVGDVALALFEGTDVSSETRLAPEVP